jgi:hypothetical protein
MSDYSYSKKYQKMILFDSFLNMINTAFDCLLVVKTQIEDDMSFYSSEFEIDSQSISYFAFQERAP